LGDFKLFVGSWNSDTNSYMHEILCTCIFIFLLTVTMLVALVKSPYAEWA